jgi:DNA-binding transcriptional LysR family regulator
MHKPLPPLSSLRSFEAVARQLSFSKAAEELHVTPVAVSQQIRALEDLLGAKLFDRTRRWVALTFAELAMQAAIDGAGVVLGRVVLAEGDLAAGRLVRPFWTTLRLDVSYFLVRSSATTPRPEILCFQNWLFCSLKQGSATRTPSSRRSRNA